DKKTYDLATARNEAESMIYLAKKTVDEFKDKISKEIYDKVSAAQSKLEESIKGTDPARIRADTDSLKKALEEIGGSMYGQQQGPNMGGGAGEGPGQAEGTDKKGYEHVKKGKKKGASGENVVEGEYEKVDE